MAAFRPSAEVRTGVRDGSRPRRRLSGRRTLAVAALTGAITAVVLTGCGQVPDDKAAMSDPGRASSRATSAAPTAGTSALPSGRARTGGSATPTASAGRPSSTAAATKPSTDRKPGPSTDAGDKSPARPTAPVLAIGDNGSRVRELQARLQQLDWFAGKITEHYGTATAAAVKGFQTKRGLPGTGALDETTWTRLVAMTRQPSHDELYNIRPAGPAILSVGDTGDRVKELQARLVQLDWFAEKITGYYGDVTAAGVRGFQDKRGLPTTGAVDQRTWDRLVGMTHQPTPTELAPTGTTGPVSAATLDPRCLTGRAMCIDKTTDQLVWVIDGKPQMRFDVRFGADTSPTREGSFAVGWKARDWVSTIYHSAMPYSMFFSGGQAVHYSSDFAARGYAGASHGCVNVRDLDGLRTLFDQVRVGDKVIVYRS